MTKERFEELVEIACRSAFGEFWSFLDIELVRDALTAVYPLIRDDVIGKCAEELVKLDNKDATGDEYTQGCYDENFWARVTIRALKSKEPKL